LPKGCADVLRDGILTRRIGVSAGFAVSGADSSSMARPQARWCRSTRILAIHRRLGARRSKRQGLVSVTVAGAVFENLPSLVGIFRREPFAIPSVSFGGRLIACAATTCVVQAPPCGHFRSAPLLVFDLSTLTARLDRRTDSWRANRHSRVDSARRQIASRSHLHRCAGFVVGSRRWRRGARSGLSSDTDSNSRLPRIGIIDAVSAMMSKPSDRLGGQAAHKQYCRICPRWTAIRRACNKHPRHITPQHGLWHVRVLEHQSRRMHGSNFDFITIRGCRCGCGEGPASLTSSPSPRRRPGRSPKVLAIRCSKRRFIPEPS